MSGILMIRRNGVAHKSDRRNTIALLGRAYSQYGFKIVDGVIGAGFPIRPKHSAVFAQIGPEGARASELARRAGMSAQAMGEIIDELEAEGWVERIADPSDRRAKIVRLTELGQENQRAGETAALAVEDDIVERIGVEGHRQLRELLEKLLA